MWQSYNGYKLSRCLNTLYSKLFYSYYQLDLVEDWQHAYGCQHALRAAVANDIATEAWKIAQANKKEAVNLLNTAIEHSFFATHRNLTTAHKVINLTHWLFTSSQAPLMATHAQSILLDMKKTILELPTVEKQRGITP